MRMPFLMPCTAGDTSKMALQHPPPDSLRRGLVIIAPRAGRVQVLIIVAVPVGLRNFLIAVPRVPVV
jgi:hypothetical protein